MPEIRGERLAYWYLRLNGFLTTVNFIVHPEFGDGQRTDADVLGVRFPYRAELGHPAPMEDDQSVTGSRHQALVLIAEAKRGMCDLNGPWTNPDAENMERVLRAIGVFPEPEIPQAAAALYRIAGYESHQTELRLACFGNERNVELGEKYPKLIQMTWGEVLDFVYRRFTKYRRQKVSHGQWDRHGHALWNSADAARSSDDFLDRIEVL